MNKFILATRSRTFWTVVVLVLMNTLPIIKNHYPASWLDTASAILGLLATYFHVNPSQNYNAPQNTQPSV